MLYLATHPRHGMHTSRIPTEICEHVIDACYIDPDTSHLHGSSYDTWCQTALVCYDWLPRSQLNLFRDIEICSKSDLDLLERTFSDAPHLADLVEGVHVFLDDYIPFARLVNPQLLRNCVRLSFVEVPWNIFPARYADHSIRPFVDNSGITHLNIELDQSSCDSLLQCLYTLPLLQELTLSAESGTQFAEDVLAPLHDRPCPFTNLKTLRLVALQS
ncbi:hypothetical protein C8Q74DRAFT_258205 [Fomes fomentarius]|nr:hypothetical protein C8Q74DRAFT_258205 [Fomes fomentarius]